jgi:hypothetical protein
MKLKIDVQKSTINGLNGELSHSNLELKEIKELSKIYEEKCDDLLRQITEANTELSTNRRNMISHV